MNKKKDQVQASVEVVVPEPIREVALHLQRSGYEAYFVGGAVRDALLGRQGGDWDICTSARPEEILPLFPKVIPTGLKHGTLTVLTEEKNPVEVTTFRIEGKYSDGRHPDEVTFTKDLAADLSRRDFTVNAMAWDPKTGELHDPFAGGRDLQARLIRTVGDAKDRFSEDGLRTIRAVRFAAQLEFALDPEILKAIPETIEITRRVAVERIRDELMKMLQAQKPSIGLRLLQQTGLLELVIPELAEGVAVEQNEYHAYDVFEHSLHACDASEGPPLLRLAVLLHDVGKPRTRQFLRGAYHFYGHDHVGAKMTDEILSRLRFSNEDRAYVVNLVTHHMFYYRDEWSDSAVRRLMRKVGKEQIEDLLALRVADEKASGVNAPDYERLAAFRKRMDKLQAEDSALNVKQLAIDGRDVMQTLGLKPGPEVGTLLEALLDKVIDDPALNKREKLLEMLGKMKAK